MKKLLIIFTMMLAAMSAFSQKQERAYVRKANSLYKDSLYTQSEVLYRKALDMNSGSVEARYNLGNNLFASGKYDEALKEYEKASKLETDKAKLGQIYHNMGVAYQIRTRTRMSRIRTSNSRIRTITRITRTKRKIRTRKRNRILLTASSNSSRNRIFQKRMPNSCLIL